jgi:hypothetical protein
VTHDEKQALLDQLALDRALIEADIIERERREAMGEVSYWQLPPLVTKDARGTPTIYKTNEHALAVVDTEQQLRAEINAVLDTCATETGIMRRGIEDRIDELAARLDEIEARLDAMEAEAAANE